MTATNDLDRVLTEWLDEGPKRAPERPIQLAVEHARAHPRRPDPIWFMRGDVMTPRAFPVAFQPVFALLALGLLLAVVVAVGVGSRGDDNVVPPTVLPSVGPTVLPTGPVATPSPTPPTIKFNEETTFTDETGNPVRITVYDLSGLLERISSRVPSSQDPIGEGGIGAVNDPTDPNTVELVWVSCVSQAEYLLTVDPVAGTLVLESPPCEGDLAPVGRQVDLLFSRAVSAEGLEVTWRQESAGDPGG